MVTGKEIYPNSITGIQFLIYSKSRDGILFIMLSVILSNFIDINIHPKINNIKPKLVFVTNTGEFINLLNSFFISDFIGVNVFIL